ncbi:Outer membrane efflux protein BepC [Kordia antarctica]|uniref:Outer membrane efflux protein BepC n=1 Tax=Kordia antarctica TaxID=1218801 RepID=A0A7L4ZQN1_9FLAO|nr:TolC family protein [Kordia antarctica]QHI38194.1 Outer membrane efflux protein BepC [Kordia antarctica]
MKKVFIYILLITVTITSVHAQKNWTLKECVEYALENNISIKQSALDRQNTELDKSDAIGNFLPTVNVSASHSWNIGLNPNPVTGQNITATTQSSSGGLNVGIDIYRGLQNQNRLHRANLALLANQYQLDDIKDNTSLQVVQRFLQILFNKESLKVLQTQYQVTLGELKRTNELVKEGVVPRGDALEIEANAATQEQQIVNAENALRFSKISLAQLLLINDYENFAIAEGNYMIPSTTIMNNTPKQIFEKSLEVRNNVKISESNIELAEYDLKIAKGARLPSLSGFYGFNTRYFDTELGSTPPFFDQISDNKGHSFGVQLNIPILNGFSARNNIRRNVINIERAKYNLDQVKIDLEATVNQAYNDTKGSLKAYEAAEKTLISRTEAHKYSVERFNEGMMNSFDFSQSKQRLESAESDVVRTKFDYIFKLKILEFYFGLPLTDLK